MPVVTTASQSCHTLADWLYYIEQSHPIHQIELGLERILRVAEKAGLQQLPGIKILFAGTNGKGTTIRTLEQLLLKQGYSVGVYSSPHLLRFNERLRLNDIDVADQNWVEAFAFVEALRADIALTYFEFTTLAAFYLLCKAKPQYCLIEVGLGGRLDATNIIEPDISVITTIDLDHQDWLGPDRESIGREKAGIFRSGKPAVVGELVPPQSLLQYAAQLQTPVVAANQHYRFLQYTESWSWQGSRGEYAGLPYCAVPVQNMATALAIAEQLQCLPAAGVLRQTLSALSLAGRMQWLQQQPAVLLDVAHNPQSVAYLATQLKQLQPAYRRIHALVGMLKDKDITQSLQNLTLLFDQWHLVTLEGPRGAQAGQLATALRSVQDTKKTVELYCYQEQAGQVYQHVLAQLQPDELLVVFGSFLTVSAVLAHQHQEAK